MQALLRPECGDRLTADECLFHPWLSGDVIYRCAVSTELQPAALHCREVINELETTWMRRCLARRR